MTIKRVKQAANCRGIYFNGLKQWQNNVVGYGYFCFTPNGSGFITSDTLTGLYRCIMKYPKITWRCKT